MEETDETEEPVPCPSCGQINMRGDWAYLGGLNDYCWGCAGYPFCSCDDRHTGDCAHMREEV